MRRPAPHLATGEALCERYLTVDDAVDVAGAGPRERSEAIARSIRDMLSQRWIQTEKTYSVETSHH